MITKVTDFKGRFRIANSDDHAPNSDLTGNHSLLKDFIDEFEPQCCITILGYSLYKELQPELLKQPFVGGATETADQKWIDLVNGKENYEGLVKCIVPYIYFKFLKDDDSSHTGVGVVNENPKGAVMYSAREKAVEAWRAFYQATCGEYSVEDSLLFKQSYVGPILGIIYAHDSLDKEKSLYTFLEENKNIYPNANPTPLSNINQYGL